MLTDEVNVKKLYLLNQATNMLALSLPLTISKKNKRIIRLKSLLPHQQLSVRTLLVWL